MRARPEIPSEIEEFRDERWRREGARQVSNALEAERFIDQVGFAACLTDSRRPGASLYVAVCGRRDAVMPRNVQKDEEASATWLLKDELIRRGNVYYAKLARGKTMFTVVWQAQRCEDADEQHERGRAGHAGNGKLIPLIGTQRPTRYAASIPAAETGTDPARGRV